MNTIDDAKKYLRENFDKGIECPCCGQFVKLYKRRINSAMAYFLICCYRWSKVRGDYFRIKQIHEQYNLPVSMRGGDEAKLRFWNLIEIDENDGVCTLTRYGKEFIEGSRRMAKYKYFYNNKVYRSSDETVSIEDCLGKRFNFVEIMQSSKTFDKI